MLKLFLFVFVLSLTTSTTINDDDDDLVKIEPTNILPMFDPILRPITGLVDPKSKKGQSRAGVPQSLTLLMNFKTDGTTSFQILQGEWTTNEKSSRFKHRSR